MSNIPLNFILSWVSCNNCIIWRMLDVSKKLLKNPKKSSGKRGTCILFFLLINAQKHLIKILLVCCSADILLQLFRIVCQHSWHLKFVCFWLFIAEKSMKKEESQWLSLWQGHVFNIVRKSLSLLSPQWTKIIGTCNRHFSHNNFSCPPSSTNFHHFPNFHNLYTL